MCVQREGVGYGGHPPCSTSGLSGSNGKCAVVCKSGFSDKTRSFGVFECLLGDLSVPDLSCKPIKCDTSKLKTGGSYNSKRTDTFTTKNPLDFGEKVSFGCKDGYAIQDRAILNNILNDEKTCNDKWNDEYEPRHNQECKVRIECNI